MRADLPTGLEKASYFFSLQKRQIARKLLAVCALIVCNKEYYRRNPLLFQEILDLDNVFVSVVKGKHEHIFFRLFYSAYIRREFGNFYRNMGFEQMINLPLEFFPFHRKSPPIRRNAMVRENNNVGLFGD